MRRKTGRAARLVLGGLLLALVTGLAACSPGSAGDTPLPAGDETTLPPLEPVRLGEGEKLRVVATTSIIGDVVAQVGDEAIDLTVLIGRGQDPHSYEPVARDLAAIERAHVIFVNGLGLEEGLMSSIEATANGPIVSLSAGIEPLEFAGGGHDQGGEGEQTHTLDPHVWMDPGNVIIWTETIRDTLSTLDPTHAELYASNAEAYIRQLEALDAYIREQVAKIPPERRKLVTDHMTFGYFAKAYGFEMIGTIIPGVTTTAGASAGDMAALVNTLQEEGVTAIFVGISASDQIQQLTETLAQEAGTSIRVLPLYTGSLDEPGEPGDSYLGMMRYNVDQIVAGLAPSE